MLKSTWNHSLPGDDGDDCGEGYDGDDGGDGDDGDDGGDGYADDDSDDGDGKVHHLENTKSLSRFKHEVLTHGLK